MGHVKSYAVIVPVCAVLCLSACQTVKTIPAGDKTSAQAVVLMDPMIDDAMLPSVGESLSDGRVKIYSLDPNVTHPLPITVGQQSAHIGMPPAQPGLSLKPPAGMRTGGGSDGVEIYSIDDVVPMVPSAPLVAPTIQPPIAVTKQALLPSPFDGDGELAAKQPPGPVNEPVKKKSRPKRGMTY